MGWIAAILLFDFCDYWLRRAGHGCAVLWAAHSVHHQSRCFNLSTALRQESLVAVPGWPFYLPMAVLGNDPLRAIVGPCASLWQDARRARRVDAALLDARLRPASAWALQVALFGLAGGLLCCT